MDQRFFLIPPSSRNTLMGLARYTEQAFVGGTNSTIRTGEIGNLYGIPVFVSSNCDTASGTNNARVCLMGHKDSLVLVEQMAIRHKFSTNSRTLPLCTLPTHFTEFKSSVLRQALVRLSLHLCLL
jgi:hypothetical protein